MPYYRVVGEIPRKRHVQFRRPDGGLYAEELMGVEGFSADSSLLYHRHLPTAIVKAEAVTRTDGTDAGRPTAALAPPPPHPGPADRRRRRHRARLLAGNDDVRMSYAATDGPQRAVPQRHGRRVRLHRHRPGQVRVGLRRDRGRRGRLRRHPHRHDPPLGSPGPRHRRFAIEAAGHIRPPKRYLSHVRPVPGARALLRARPARPGRAADRRGRGGAGAGPHPRRAHPLIYRHHPFDVVGWDGCLYPYAFNIADFEPIVRRTHAPPPVHQTFEGPNFVVCSFCPACSTSTPTRCRSPTTTPTSTPTR